jgi:O-antigen/teichoic acid export membrane protein
VSKNSFLKSGRILVAGNGLSALSSFLRNIIIARLISVEDFGIASIFALTMTAVEVAGNLSVDKIIIQDKNGDDESFQSSGHAFIILRGLISGIMLFLSAEYVADFFNVPETAWAFEILSLITIIKGFMHLDYARFQREMNFRPIVIIETLPQIIILLLSIPLTLWLKSYAAVVWLLLISTILTVTLSHIYAKRKYLISWNTSTIKRIYKFGWPLLINGLLMLVILQGDKAIVGRAYSMEVLGWYSAAFILTLSPALIIAKILTSMMLPWLARSKDDSQLFTVRSELALNYFLMSGLILSLSFTLIGAELVTLLFGVDYAAGSKIIALLAFMQFVRIAKAGPILVAMSAGDTKNAMLSNIIRGVAFLLAALSAWYGSDIITIVIFGLLGELAAFFISMILLVKNVNHRLITTYKSAFICFISAFILIQFDNIVFLNNNYVLGKVAMTLTSIFILLMALQLMPKLKSTINVF